MALIWGQGKGNLRLYLCPALLYAQPKSLLQAADIRIITWEMLLPLGLLLDK